MVPIGGLLLSNCAYLKPLYAPFGEPATEEQKTALSKTLFSSSEVECDSSDCDEKWGRAQFWVSKHSRVKIQIATDVILETYNSTDHPYYSINVTKEPLGSGRHKIAINFYCGTDIFDCDPPTEDQAKNSFYHYLNTGKDVIAEADGWLGLR
jgi:hypothetical protein